MYKLRSINFFLISKTELHLPGIEPGPPGLQADTLLENLFKTLLTNLFF
jgi:hypothetical protein